MSPRALRGSRWDPAFWRPGRVDLAAACALPLAPLGTFIETLTYGPILPGQRPQPAPHGVAIVGQKELLPTGVVLDQATRVAEGSPFDLPRCRLRPGDVLLARSGAGTLAQKRFTVFATHTKATVSCFVDILRLKGISPYYVVTFLRCGLGWPQIERLLSGVGTPNLNFAQIRSLRIPLLPTDEQEGIEAAWREVTRLHSQRDYAAAEAELDRLAEQLQSRLKDQPT